MLLSDPEVAHKHELDPRTSVAEVKEMPLPLPLDTPGSFETGISPQGRHLFLMSFHRAFFMECVSVTANLMQASARCSAPIIFARIATYVDWTKT